MLSAESPFWHVAPILEPHDVAGLQVLSDIDRGNREIEVMVRVDGVIGERWLVSKQTAGVMLQRIVGGWMLPPAMHLYWMQGLPALPDLVEKVQRYTR